MWRGEIMTTPISFGQWLKQRRKALDLTREDLAGKIGCAAVTLNKIEADERRPSKQMAELFAEHLNIPPHERSAFVRFARSAPTQDAALWGTGFHPPTNLTVPPTVLIGRDEEVAVIGKRLLRDESRLLTLLGPPGIGKTRLALAVAAQVLDDFSDGVFFIALAPITDANLVSTTIADTLGVPDIGPRTPLERLKAFLTDKEMLIVLDNFEQILAAAPQIAELLTVCSQLKVLMTSRAPLRIRQERQIPVSSLELPDLAHLPDAEAVSQYSAVTLFLERAQAVKPDFALTEDNAPTVAALCARLDGLPLAIELISARVKLLPPAALLERLGGRLLLQSDGLRDLEPRHRTLNAAIDWSYQLLSTEEQALFRRLGVFMGGWTLDAAQAVCMDGLSVNLLDGLASLLDKNLIKQEVALEGEPRFMMLETICEYALEQLVASDELDKLRKYHATYFVVLADAVQPRMTGIQRGLWWARLEIELDNFRAALAWGQTEVARETELHLAISLGDFWRLHGHLSEGSGWLTDALEQQVVGSSEVLSETDRMTRAVALSWLGTLRTWQGDLDAVQPLLEESLALMRELEERATRLRDNEHQLEYAAGIATVLREYGHLCLLRGDHEQASIRLNESLVLWRKLGNANGLTTNLQFLGNLAYSQGFTSRADIFWAEGLALSREAGNRWVISTLLAKRAMVAVDQGDYRQARTQLIESLTILQEMGERWQIVQTLEVFACLETAQAVQSEDRQLGLLRSAHIFGAAEALRETLAAPVFPFQQHFNERGITSLHAQLDAAPLEAAWTEGRAMTLEQFIAYALSEG
jgi:predicted ATPase/transcriptional regulator with XRE-family HTH domain